MTTESSRSAGAATLPETMRVRAAVRAGGPEVLEAQERPVPQPGPGELLVRTEATGVNFIETYQRSGTYPVDYPFVPGTEAVGTVVALGEGTDGPALGTRVATSQGRATYAECFVVRADQVVEVPQGISAEDAACLPLQGATAHYLVRSTFPVQAGQTVLFHAAAGGVGGLAVQYLKHLGATVIGTVSTEEKEKIARAHGADHVLRYDGFAEAVRELTDGEGVHVVYDSVGKDTFADSLTALRTRGTAVLFGGASGQVPPFDLQRLNALGSLYVTRPTLNDYLRDREELEWRMGELFEGLEQGWLKVTVDRTFPLGEAAAAHEYLEDRRTRGKVLLVP